jgi:hypothetical protein
MDTTISLAGQQLHFTVRRQGSVFVFCPTPSAAQAAANTSAHAQAKTTAQTAAQAEANSPQRSTPQLPQLPTFVQLDGWHEASHPSWWRPDFVFEAELHDGFQV